MSDGPPLEDDFAPIWTYIKAFQADNGYSPTLREIADGLDLHFARVNRVIQLMATSGYIQRPERRSRALVLVKEPPQVSRSSSA